MNGEVDAREQHILEGASPILVTGRRPKFGIWIDAGRDSEHIRNAVSWVSTRIVGVDLARQQDVNTNDIMVQKVCGLNVVQAGFCRLHLLLLVRLILSSRCRRRRRLPSLHLLLFFCWILKHFCLFNFHFFFLLGVVAVGLDFDLNERDSLKFSAWVCEL